MSILENEIPPQDGGSCDKIRTCSSSKVCHHNNVDKESIPLQQSLQYNDPSSSSSRACLLSQMTDIALSQGSFSVGRGLSQFDTHHDDQDFNPGDDIQNCDNRHVYNKDEIKVKMQQFKHDDVSSHIFLKPAQGTLHDWEHIPRRYFYIQMLKPVLNELSRKDSNLSMSNAYDQMILNYKSIAGTAHSPPFYTFDKQNSNYIKLTDKEVQSYIKSLFEKMDRVVNTIKKYEEAPGGKLRKLLHKQNEVSYLYHITILLQSFPYKLFLCIYHRTLQLLP